MEHNMKVESPCAKCQHAQVCKHVEIMDEVQRRVNETFFDSSLVGRSSDRYVTINKMSNAGITAVLRCKNYKEID